MRVQSVGPLGAAEPALATMSWAARVPAGPLVAGTPRAMYDTVGTLPSRAMLVKSPRVTLEPAGGSSMDDRVQPSLLPMASRTRPAVTSW